MKSIKDIYKIGYGPSSSHTMGPSFAADYCRAKHPEADFFRVVLYGSLAKTGKGHQTDKALAQSFAPVKSEIIFDMQQENLPHPNTMDIYIYREKALLEKVRAISVGGGDVVYDPPVQKAEDREVYAENSFFQIASYCKSHNIRLSDYVYSHEEDDLEDYLMDVWKQMNRAIEEGLAAQGELPGGLHVERKAQYLFNQRHIDESDSTRENRIVCAYAFATAEQNASAGKIVTAPTCGSCGVLPAALRYMQEKKGFSDRQVCRALAVGGLIGDLIRQNASISGAECGCQAEIGSACSMTSAALAELHEMGIDQIEYAAEVAMEHHLGLTCDPIYGLVQIPCIERNAVAAMRAINALSLSNFLTSTRKISFDMVVETMRQTGMDLNRRYRETAEGGLASLYTVGQATI